MSTHLDLNTRFLRTFGLLDANGCPILTPQISPQPAETVVKVPDLVDSRPDFPLVVEPDGPGTYRLVLRVTPEAHRWAQGLADHCSLTITDLIWQSLMRQADASGYHHRVPTRYISTNPGRRRRPGAYRGGSASMPD